MEKRLVTFFALTALMLVINFWVQAKFFAPIRVAQQGGDKAAAGAKADAKGKAAAAGKAAGDKKEADDGKPDTAKPDDENAVEDKAGEDKDGQPAAVVAEEKPAADAAVNGKVEPEPVITPQWVSLGSADPAQPYRMLVTLTNRGAAIERVELNSPRYRDLDDRAGYLGFLATADAPKRGGSLVQVVGAGTPAAAAGLKPGDIIEALDGRHLENAAELDAALNTTQPGQTVELTLHNAPKVSATLVRRPLELIRPEFDSKSLDVVPPGGHDPLSMLLTLEQVGERTIDKDAAELGGVKLLTDNWEVVTAGPDEAVFRKRLPALGLELIKRYRLAKVAAEEGEFQPAYHLMFDVEIQNLGQKTQEIAYRLDGPTGLVLEGAWYASKISRNWGSAGLRDIYGKFRTQGNFASPPEEVGCPTIAGGESKPWPTSPVEYAAVDAQYFSAALLPDPDIAEEFATLMPIRVGAVPKEKSDYKLTDVSFRLISRLERLEPNASPLKHTFTLFLGPKQPALLANYGPPDGPLSDLVYYGLFGWVAKPMLSILHGFYALVRNYGIAIVMLTVLVRGGMFPLSRKQAVSAQKMQELQPEIKRIAEKYKKSPEQRTKAQQELFAKHNYNPLGGCLLMFIQLPIFMGLYRSLMVDVELRQAPLISNAIRWCSNLAAPDMLFDWRSFMPGFIVQGNSFLMLGPYLNLLPLVTIGLFIWQQKMFMPPAADEQAAMQQKMMQYMMIFMGVMFFKVASGLCLYFIASSIWGITERKLLHPPQKPAGDAGGGVLTVASTPSPGGNGSGGRGKSKERGRK